MRIKGGKGFCLHKVGENVWLLYRWNAPKDPVAEVTTNQILWVEESFKRVYELKVEDGTVYVRRRPRVFAR